MSMFKRHERYIVQAAALVALLMVFSSVTYAMDVGTSGNQEPRILNLVVGKSIVLRSVKPVVRVSIASPKISDLVLISPHEIYFTGKAPGVTSVTLWHKNGVSEIYELRVTFDISLLKQRLHEILPDEKDIRVMATHDSITLSGTVSSATHLSEALILAKAYAPEGRVNNLMRLGGVQQVMLEVRIAEMSRSLIRRLGINFNYVRGGDFGVSMLGGLSQLATTSSEASLFTQDGKGITSPVQFMVSPSVDALFRFSHGQASWTGFIDALKQDGLVKILAEPTLIALSGKTATFLAGGEFPFPVPQGLGTVAIQYKKFGVGLSFTPTVLSEKEISIKVEPEVSELDYSSGLQYQGFMVPGITTRKASTVVNLADGQSFAIAGLLKDNVRNMVHKFPLLGDIPILGALFRSSAFQKHETELIIIVTPHLARPLDMKRQGLPTDYYKDPNDTEFYFLGLMEGREWESNSSLSAHGGDLDGDFGHAIPK